MTSQRITIPVLGDTLVEPNETFSLNLSQPNNATILKGQGIATIRDDITQPTDLPTLSISHVLGVERNQGVRNFVFDVKLSNSFRSPVSVNYATQDQGAIAGVDYNRSSGLLMFNPGETNKQIQIGVIGDRTVEATESFAVQLSDPVNATIKQARAVGTVLNDDFRFFNRVAEVIAGGLSTVGNLLNDPFSSSRTNATMTLANSSLDSLSSNH